MFDESPKPSKEEIDDARQAVRLSMFSYLGMFIPIIGIILACYALSLTKYLRHFEGQLGRKVALARRNSWIAICLSLLMVAGWSSGFYLYKQYAEVNQRRIQREECLNKVEAEKNTALSLGPQVDEQGYFIPVNIAPFTIAAEDCRAKYPE